MFSILLISHGPLAQAMVKSAGMVGGHDGRAHAIEIDRDTKKEHLKEQIRKKITELLALWVHPLTPYFLSWESLTLSI